MAHFALCSRANTSPAAPPTLDTTMKTHLKKHDKPDDPLSWQQQEDFGTQSTQQSRKRGRKAKKFIPLDLNSIDSRPRVTANDRVPLAQQPEKPVRGRRQKARGKATARDSPHQSVQSAPAEPATLPQSLDNVTKKARSNRKRRHKGKARTEHSIAGMIAQRSGAYIPPHVRKRATAFAKPRTNVKLGDCIGVGSPPDSVKSQPDKADQKHVSSDEVVAQAHTPPPSPTTVADPPKPSGGFAGWDEPVPEQSLAPPRRSGNPHWGRPPKREKHVWVKSKDIPKELSDGSQSDGGVAFKSDSEGDPSYDVKKLMQWNGDWLPPPEEWAARKGFTQRHFSQVIEVWANEHSKLCTNLIDTDSPAFLGIQIAGDKWMTKDLVPRYWLHESIDSDSPRKFWEELPNRAPAPLSDVDMMEDPPYWERWEDDHPNHCFMDPLVVPEARIDTKDSDNELESPFAMLCTNERLARIQEIQASEKRRREARRNRPIRPISQLVPQLPNRDLHPKANIYLRPVSPADVRGIMTIYNHYVAHTVHAYELEECTEADIRGRIDNIIKADLPFLVAVAKRNQRKGPQGYVSETIVGYVHLEDYVDRSSMYRYTFELNLYVHPGYIRQGIGKCLLDRLMFIANTGYNAKGGYEWINYFEYLKNGKSRVVKTILTNLHYERGSENEVEWATSYLGDFGFKKAGRFAQVGHKEGKVVDKVMFQLQTTEVIDPKSIPMVQG